MTRAKKKRAEEMIFEVWQVIKPVSPNDEFDGHNKWPPITITEPEKNLSEVCMKKYGRGDFVALHLAESRMGFPLSHWVVKVRSPELHNSMRVHPDEEYLSIAHEQYIATGDVGELFYRGREAAVTSLCLQELEEPKAKEAKVSRRKRRPENARAIELIRIYGTKDIVIEKLIAEGRGNARWGWERKGDPALREAAEKAYGAGMVAVRRERKPRTTKKVGKAKDGA